MELNGKTLRVPLIQGGMGVGVSLGNLAGHVAFCGAMGTISTADVGYREPDYEKSPREACRRALCAELKKAKSIACGRGLVGVNAMVATSQYEEMVTLAAENGADFIISGAGLPLTLPALAGKSGVMLAPIVSSAKAAGLICRVWDQKYGRAPDFVVLEGCQAGGHLGFHEKELTEGTALSLEELIPAVLAALAPYCEKYGRQIPLFAAGGVDSPARISQCLALGAAGVQVATPFIATEECDASEGYKNRILAAKEEEICIIKSPVGMPGRALKTPFLEKVQRLGRVAPSHCRGCLKTCDPAKAPYCITDALIAAVRGDEENGLFFCGAQGWRLKNRTTVSEIINGLFPQEEK